MAKIRAFTDLGSIKTPEEYMRHSSQAIESTADVVNGNLEFDHNLNTSTVTVVFPTANADVAVDHTLGKIAQGYLIGKKSVDCSVYDGTKAATKTTSYLRSTQPATVTLIMF